MDKKTDIAASAAQLFAEEGLRRIGIDHISAHVGASTRTIYKHFGSRDGLVLAALESRHRAYMDDLKMDSLHSHPIGSLFDTLQRWSENFGALGCLLLRASIEYRVANAEIVKQVDRQKREFRQEITRRVDVLLGYDDPRLCAQIWILLEGATAAASLGKAEVIGDAKTAALLLLASAQGA